MEGSSKSASSSSESSSTTTGSAAAGSSSFVTELFGKPPAETKPRSVFDELFSTAPPTGVRRDYYGSGGQAWKNEQSWSQLMTSPDGSSSYTDREIAQLSDKSSSFPAYTHKMTEHTLSSSIHYGGRDDYVVTSDSHNQYTQKPTTYDGNSEDGSGGASPRGNIWLGSVYY